MNKLVLWRLLAETGVRLLAFVLVPLALAILEVVGAEPKAQEA